MTTVTPTAKCIKGILYTPELDNIITKVLNLKADATDSPSILESEERERKLAKKGSKVSAALALLPFSDARAILETAKSTNNDTDDNKNEKCIPLGSIKAIKSCIIKSNESIEAKDALLQQLEDAVMKSTLLITAPGTAPNMTRDRKKFLERIERLKLKNEERKYTDLTSNLDKTVADDATMKSMMYATSVGLNMIVAPISFGAFMYFFSGGLLSRFFDDEDRISQGGVDIRSVIAGVLSGVIMLFIEMILFVIRSHEMDASIRKKAKTSNVNPFGYDKKKAERTFTG